MFTQGHLYRRSELHDRYGGQRQGGISTPSQHPFLMLFTGESGEQHGYTDGWAADGLFLYTGEGQQGDMAFVRIGTTNGIVVLASRQPNSCKRPGGLPASPASGWLCAKRYLGEKRGQAWIAQLRQAFPPMVRIVIRPDWVGVLDLAQRYPQVIDAVLSAE